MDVEAVPLGASDELDIALLRLHGLALTATIHAGQAVDPPLTATQIRVLTLLAASADGLAVTAIAEALAMSAPSTSRLCQRMVRDGMVDRSAGPGHYIIMSLSAHGARLLREVNRARVKPIRQLINQLSRQQRAVMIRQLDELGRLAQEHHEMW